MQDVTKLVGLLWALFSMTLAFFLLRKNWMNKWVSVSILLISVLLGFSIFSPMLPFQFQEILIPNGGGKGPGFLLPLIGLLVIVVSSSALGRTFCGYSCPVGALQELMYRIPVPKLRWGKKWILLVFRWAFLAAMIVSGLLFGVSFLYYLGGSSFFRLDPFGWPFYVFAFLAVLSLFYYRPICRIFCPVGALMSLSALIRGARFRRNENCTDCGKCERACPVDEAGPDDLKLECYACNRCREACPFDALDYTFGKGR